MSFSCGIVGLPNVGKSSLFNALTKKRAASENYPFCTIEPNKAIVSVPDERLEKLAKINKSLRIVPTAIEFIDIAGLVEGASKGEGLGNKFLSHIREVNAIIEVVRLFRSPNIIRETPINPLADLEIIHMELRLADINTVSRRLEVVKKNAKRENAKQLKMELALLEKLDFYLNEEKWLYHRDFDASEKKILRSYQLLTYKPLLVVLNIDENDVNEFEKNPLFKKMSQYCDLNTLDLTSLCINLEAEISLLEKGSSVKEYREALGIQHFGLECLIKKCYQIQDLITYFTSGEKESRAWTIKRGTLAPRAAGKIHEDLERGFIKAEVVSAKDYIENNSFKKSKELGQVRLEGKEYVVKDGDVCLFKFNL